jgi:hypothetical protein
MGVKQIGLPPQDLSRNTPVEVNYPRADEQL